MNQTHCPEPPASPPTTAMERLENDLSMDQRWELLWETADPIGSATDPYRATVAFRPDADTIAGLIEGLGEQRQEYPRWPLGVRRFWDAWLAHRDHEIQRMIDLGAVR